MGTREEMGQGRKFERVSVAGHVRRKGTGGAGGGEWRGEVTWEDQVRAEGGREGDGTGKLCQGTSCSLSRFSLDHTHTHPNTHAYMQRHTGAGEPTLPRSNLF